MEDNNEMKRGIANDDELGLQTEEEWLKDPQRKAELLGIELRKLESRTHMKTLMGGQPDVLLIGKEAFDNFIPEIRDFLRTNYSGKIILKKRMWNPIIRHIYFDDNMKFTESGGQADEGVPEVNITLELEKEFDDYDYSVFARKEYFVDDIDDDAILRAIKLNKEDDSE